MYNVGILYLILVFAATLWGGLVIGPQRILPFLIFAQTMLLPAHIVWTLPGVPDLDKVTAVTLPAILLVLVTKRERWRQYRSAWPDLLLYGFVTWAFFSVLLNNGAYSALSRLMQLSVSMLIPYVAGRLYLQTSDDLFAFVKAIAPLVLVYVLGMLIESRLSPFLSERVFGVWAPAFARLGFYRPVMLASGALELGHYMTLTTVLLLGARRGWRGLGAPMPRLLGFACWAAGLGACLSMSRGPTLGLALALLPPLVLRNTRWIGAALSLAGLAFFLWMLTPQITGAELAAMLGGGNEEGSYGQTVGYRFLQIDAFEPLVYQRPIFGWGEQFSRTGEIQIIDGILLIHTLYYGFPGAVLIMGFWTAVAFYVGRAAYPGNSPLAFVGQLLAPVIGWLAFSAWGDSFLREPHLLIMSATVGAMLAERRLSRPLLQPVQRTVFVSG
ncbi:MAG: hypothetical protein R3F56_09015 [Planctomycetota bacterium]